MNFSEERIVLSFLRRAKKPLTLKEIQEGTGMNTETLVRALLRLYSQRKVKKKYTCSYDPARPFDTAAWYVADQEEQVKASDLKWLVPIISVPAQLWRESVEILTEYSAMDLFDAYSLVVESAKQELKIACPVMDSYGILPVINRVKKNPRLKVRIIAELDKSIELVRALPTFKEVGIEVADPSAFSSVSGRRVKVRGVHAKIAVGDERLALVGTFNFSRHHYTVNFDVGFLIEHPRVISFLSSLFEKMWNVSKKVI